MTAIASNRRFRVLRRAVVTLGGVLFTAAIAIACWRPLNSTESRLVGCWYRPALFASRLITLDANRRYTIHTGWFDEDHNRFVAKSSVLVGSWRAKEGSLTIEEDRPLLTRIQMRWQRNAIAITSRLQLTGDHHILLERDDRKDIWTRVPSPPEVIISPDSAEP